MDYPGGAARNPQMSPQTAIDLGATQGGLDNYGFYDSGSYSAANYPSGYDVGSTSAASPPSGNISSSAYRRANAGKVGQMLDKGGFGWLLEENEEDEEQLPLLEELDIDLKDIYYKVRCVLLPLPYFRMKLSIIRESPDFWGPLMVVVAFSLLSIYGQFSAASWILTMWFGGGFMVYFIARALGGDVGYTQVLGVVGYCLIPLVFTGLLSSLMRVSSLSTAFGIFGIVWSVYSAGTMLCVDELQTKKSLVLYPVFLLYIYFHSLYSGV